MTETTKALIEAEQVYQKTKYTNHSHSVGEWLLILEKQLNDAKAQWYNNRNVQSPLREIKQIAATAASALDEFERYL